MGDLVYNFHLGGIVTQVVVGQNETIESALRRFKRQVAKAGIYQDIKKHQFFETPQEKSKRKEAARRRQRSRRRKT
jgi:small subunit ribosomal protein S21